MGLAAGLCSDPLGSPDPLAIIEGREWKGKERVGNREGVKGAVGKGKDGRRGKMGRASNTNSWI